MSKETFCLNVINKKMIIINNLGRKTKDIIKNTFLRFNYKITKIHVENTSKEIVNRKIGKFSIKMMANHQLPIFMKYQKYYSTNLPRLTVEVFKKYKDLRMIDIGANIGDTVALVRSECVFPITCIDGDGEFFKILEENVKQFKDVKIIKQLLGEKNENINAELKKNIETARLQFDSSNKNNSLNLKTLDTVITENIDLGKSKLLKIDTDGFDMKIIRGAQQYIKNTKPIIFLEYDTVFFAEHNDSGIPTLLILEEMGYDDIIFYDNLGKLIISTNLSNRLILKQMNNYINPTDRTPFPYYDIVLFHNEDRDIAKAFIENEMKYFYKDNYYAK